MKLLTKRLILRAITKKDEKDLINNISNLNVSGYLLVVPYPYTKKDARKWVEHCKKISKEKPCIGYNLVIELKGKMIGGIGLHHVDKYDGTAELGYWLGEDYWKQGIMTEAAERVLEFAFNKLKLRRLNASIFKENKASNGLIKKLGFKYEGERIKSHRVKSTRKIHNEYVYGLLRENYLKK